MQDDITAQVKEVIHEDVWQSLQSFLNYEIFHFGTEKSPIILTVGLLLFVIVVFVITSFCLKLIRKLVTRKLPNENKKKFISIFSFTRYFIYVIVIFIALDLIGFNITGIFAASAALLVGVGLALQTLIQDIISGIFIFIDQSVKVGDIFEMEGTVGRVEEIKLRTTRAVTIDNKVLIIPNHLYLTSILYNWTQNNVYTRESVTVGVAYGSDVNLVKEVLIKAALTSDKVLATPEPSVLFTDFGDSSLEFRLIFTINNCFEATIIKSEIRFAIDRLFKEHKIDIPFPQTEVTIVRK
ncbi:mechanosensitive ion channel family protein [Aquimarina hainanensis]|uniref:Mechanosensitive ion channel family protein n=1 Tax=Aquimarina hainanensis TaxID=1578017 RepID=A0ABW5N2L9_9FLAO|nr:mechanosensitive ion channel domain-containing protein [Aquimarina sp. TRL1]QKX05892.1 mechanosensitive ion channel [Aquimarina sp. TRL1]